MRHAGDIAIHDMITRHFWRATTYNWDRGFAWRHMCVSSTDRLVDTQHTLR